MKSLVEILLANAKKRGLPVAEEMANELYSAVSESAMEYAAQDAVAPIIKAIVPAAVAILDHVVRDAIDQIDGVKGDLKASV